MKPEEQFKTILNLDNLTDLNWESNIIMNNDTYFMNWVGRKILNPKKRGKEVDFAFAITTGTILTAIFYVLTGRHSHVP